MSGQGRLHTHSKCVTFDSALNLATSCSPPICTVSYVSRRFTTPKGERYSTPSIHTVVLIPFLLVINLFAGCLTYMYLGH